MRTRNHLWVDFSGDVPVEKYGVQVYAAGKWRHAHDNGKPCLYDTKEEQAAKRAELRKIKGPTP